MKTKTNSKKNLDGLEDLEKKLRGDRRRRSRAGINLA